MKIINSSYDVLSDPIKRQQHDIWIAQNENSFINSKQASTQHETVKSNSQSKSQHDLSFKDVASHILRNWRLYSFAAIAVFAMIATEQRSPPTPPKPYQAEPPPSRQTFIRPVTAPNGAPWPSSASYVAVYKRLHTQGLSTITVDNGKNNSDVFVKLVSLDRETSYPVRQFYIPAFGSFTLNKVSSGNYDIRYLDLTDGSLSRSEAFNVEETKTETGTRYSRFTMTLYKVRDGNMKTFPLAETDF